MDRFLNWWKKYSFILLIAFVLIGLIDLRFAVVAVVCMVAPIIVSVFRGRFWCGNLCPRGNFYDNVVSKFSRKRKVPKLLKSNYFRIALIIFMLSMFTLGVKQNWGNLYGIGMVFYRMIVVTTIIGIVLSLFYNERTWCNFCPIGSIAVFISKFRKNKKVLQVSSNCVSCKLCEKKCSLGIVPYEYKGDLLSHPDCIQCGKCVVACPKKSIGYDKTNKE
ncbi:4Fe-4S binding protein [Clostridium magnum]|uniref:Putative electron transport protein YccM n=1 Tax=Clostridium magnum DSM 2767 TaxID=1121326 RepID=A0A161XE58_9CLOT|nr:4Fe-4S binding protein [Clostridium magnum]KZL92656.1 putative electron transport protein YccM [Clostridium magnum DSM 2767]SHI24234.1 4Fe-4S binding domain-containing protein [Clostridium magnum DSM 2767]